MGICNAELRVEIIIFVIVTTLRLLDLAYSDVNILVCYWTYMFTLHEFKINGLKGCEVFLKFLI